MTEKTHKDVMNSQAYRDVMNIEKARYPNDEDYMRAFRNWVAADPGRYDPYFDVVDFHDETPY